MKITKDHIIQYLKGKLPEAERHDLEKLMLDDSFLNDAVEGLSHLENPEQALLLLEQIEKEIRSKTDKASLWFYSKYQFGIAAAVSLLIVSAVLVLIFREKQVTPRLAQLEETASRQFSGSDTATIAKGKIEAIDKTIPAESERSRDDARYKAIEEATTKEFPEGGKEKEMPVTIQDEDETTAGKTDATDTGAGEDITPATDPEEPTDDLLIAADEKEMEAISEILTGEAPVTLAEPDPRARQMARTEDKAVRIQATEAAGKKTGISLKTVSGTVYANNNIPLQGVNVIISETGRGAVTGKNGRYEVILDENETDLRFSHINFQPSEMAVNRSGIFDVTMTPGTAVLFEYVVAGYDNNVDAEIFDRFPGPAVYRDAYISYLKKNLVYQQEAIENKISGTVVVAFTVEESGNLSGFEIIESPGYGSGEEVIRLIKSGPSWLPAIKDGKETSERVYLSIHFDAG